MSSLSKKWDPKKPTVTYIYSTGCPFCPSTEAAFNNLVLPKAGNIEFRKLNNRDPVQGPEIFQWAYSKRCLAAPALFVNDEVVQCGAVTPKNKDKFIENMMTAIDRARR